MLCKFGTLQVDVDGTHHAIDVAIREGLTLGILASQMAHLLACHPSELNLVVDGTECFDKDDNFRNVLHFHPTQGFLGFQAPDIDHEYDFLDELKDRSVQP